jgi:hypothetical protein
VSALASSVFELGAPLPKAHSTPVLIRFGDMAVKKMKEWTVKNLPADREPAPRIMECGCGA